MNATRAVISRCPRFIRIQIHERRRRKLVFLFSFFSKWRAVLKMFVRLFRIKVSESLQKSTAGAIDKKKREKRRQKELFTS